MKLSESPQSDFDDLEIRISRGRQERYRAEMRTPTEERYSVHLRDLPGGLDSESGSHKYGSVLFEWLFQGELRNAFRQVRWAAESYSRSASAVSGVRLRLWLDPLCPELHPLIWESLRDPDPARDEPISLTMAFSRFTNVSARRSVPVRDRPIRMLFVTSNPEGLDRFDLSSMDVDLERKIVRAAVSSLGSLVHLDKVGPSATLERIQAAQMEGYHITHVLAHGVSRGGEQLLLLADATGRAVEVPCELVAKTLVSGGRPPYLVYLATPLVGEAHEGEVLLSLARMLIEAGVQAVVVIRAPIDRERLFLFGERFYGVLIQTGIIDQAIADARVAIYRPDTWDWAYPVLYMAAADGQLFARDSESFDKLLSSIRVKR